MMRMTVGSAWEDVALWRTSACPGVLIFSARIATPEFDTSVWNVERNVGINSGVHPEIMKCSSVIDAMLDCTKPSIQAVRK